MEGMPVSMVQLVEFFKDLGYGLTSEQINDLFLNWMAAGERFATGKLVQWVRDNYEALRGKFLISFLANALKQRGRLGKPAGETKPDAASCETLRP